VGRARNEHSTVTISCGEKTPGCSCRGARLPRHDAHQSRQSAAGAGAILRIGERRLCKQILSFDLQAAVLERAYALRVFDLDKKKGALSLVCVPKPERLACR
jgi:hypothetical protein